MPDTTRVSVQCTLWVQGFTPKFGCPEDCCSRFCHTGQGHAQSCASGLSLVLIISCCLGEKGFPLCMWVYISGWHLPLRMLNVTSTELQIPLWESGTWQPQCLNSVLSLPSHGVLSLPSHQGNALCCTGHANGFVSSSELAIDSNYSWWWWGK